MRAAGDLEVSVVFALPGTRVRFADRDAGEAVVLQATVRGTLPCIASYEVAWWVGGDRKTAWVEAHEVVPLAGQPVAQAVGFNKG
jgi:hypothetical protein